ncbi:MAG: hypothetical protein HPY45_08390 [Anaerolineae bacterium]|nr:hypothetical protein [Anaerolineae bacterium]
MWRSWLSARINRWVILGAVAIAVVLCLFLVFVAWLSAPYQDGRATFPTAVITLVFMPTDAPTPVPVVSATAPLPTSTPSSIAKGVFVKVYGTGGEGLRLRSAPGVGNRPKFLGSEGEVFQVMDGAALADGYTWWYLVSPNDAGRSGWAVEDFLVITAYPQ